MGGWRTARSSTIHNPQQGHHHFSIILSIILGEEAEAGLLLQREMLQEQTMEWNSPSGAVHLCSPLFAKTLP